MGDGVALTTFLVSIAGFAHKAAVGSGSLGTLAVRWGAVVSIGVLVDLAVRSRWDWVLLSDKKTFIFYADGRVAAFVPRREMRQWRMVNGWLVVSTSGGEVRLTRRQAPLLVLTATLRDWSVSLA
jgi:hypothetical protein